MMADAGYCAWARSEAPTSLASRRRLDIPTLPASQDCEARGTTTIAPAERTLRARRPEGRGHRAPQSPRVARSRFEAECRADPQEAGAEAPSASSQGTGLAASGFRRTR